MALLQTILGIMGNVSAVGLFLSPVPTFWRICRRRSTEEFSALPYALTLFNCILWTFYGSPMAANALLIVTVNGIGTVIELGYLVIFLIFAKDRRTRLQVTGMLSLVTCLFGLIATLTLFILHHPSQRADVVGVICVIVTSAMYASPLSITKKVVTTKSTEFMPFWLSVFNFVNGSCWLAYSAVARDVFVGIPNGMGATLGTVQLCLYAWYSRNRVDKRTHPNEIIATKADGEKEQKEQKEEENDIEKGIPQAQ